MNTMTILCISALLVAAAITVLLIIFCVRWENRHPEDYDQWEDITEDKTRRENNECTDSL